jgi:hypothetical protein
LRPKYVETFLIKYQRARDIVFSGVGDFACAHAQNHLTHKLETIFRRRKARFGAASSAASRPLKKLQNTMAGDAVLIAPISAQIPCYQGI